MAVMQIIDANIQDYANEIWVENFPGNSMPADQVKACDYCQTAGLGPNPSGFDHSAKF